MDPLRIEPDHIGWAAYWDPEGPIGRSSKSKAGALGDLIDQCDDDHRGPMLLDAIVAALEPPTSDGGSEYRESGHYLHYYHVDQEDRYVVRGEGGLWNGIYPFATQPLYTRRGEHPLFEKPKTCAPDCPGSDVCAEQAPTGCPPLARGGVLLVPIADAECICNAGFGMNLSCPLHGVDARKPQPGGTTNG